MPFWVKVFVGLALIHLGAFSAIDKYTSPEEPHFAGVMLASILWPITDIICISRSLTPTPEAQEKK